MATKEKFQYFELLAELLPEEDISKKEKKKLEKIIRENKKRGYISLEEFLQPSDNPVPNLP